MSDRDNWKIDKKGLLSESKLIAVKPYLDGTDCVILEHRHYRGASSPTRLVFDDYGELRAYLADHALPGDAVRLYRYPTEDTLLVKGKIPDASGKIPEGGAY